MEELLEELTQGIEARVHQLTKDWERQKKEISQEETKTQADRVQEILRMLPEEEQKWLDDRLLEKEEISEEKRAWFYRNGLADALDILRYLRNNM